MRCGVAERLKEMRMRQMMMWGYHVLEGLSYAIDLWNTLVWCWQRVVARHLLGPSLGRQISYWTVKCHDTLPLLVVGETWLFVYLRGGQLLKGVTATRWRGIGAATCLLRSIMDRDWVRAGKLILFRYLFLVHYRLLGRPLNRRKRTERRQCWIDFLGVTVAFR